jgi:hypothetical protein
MAAALLAGRRAVSAANVDPSQLHTLIVTNHADACMHVRLFRGEGNAPTTPPVKPRDLPPGESFSVVLADHPKDVYVYADVMSDPHCTDRRVAGYMEGYAWLGHVIVAGKKPKYVFISKSLG